jgi:hypothetical protein
VTEYSFNPSQCGVARVMALQCQIHGLRRTAFGIAVESTVSQSSAE